MLQIARTSRMTEQQLSDKLRSYEFYGMRIPKAGQDGLLMYIAHKVCPGHFLTAIITNDLKEACARADMENMHCVPAYVAFLYNHCPGSCWGSKENMKTWLDSRSK